MALKPTVGVAGGQEYPVLRSIQKFLQQMAEGGARAAPTVIKELLQNADDAGAKELVVVLDERPPPAQLPPDFADLFGPALLIRNTACFRLAKECENNDPDDFTAIRDVARGHKRAQATAAGRFGIGFNSVYFLTDTPLLFSRREVHLFDLLPRVLEQAPGWKFSLDDFPATAPSNAGAVKWVLEWCFPKVALADRSFGDVAIDPAGDYQQSVFRLPLRRTPSGTPAIYDDRFLREDDRMRLLREMADESARSILFLKHIVSISFSVLREGGLQPFASIEATPHPGEFTQFLSQVREYDHQRGAGPRCDCKFDRTITLRRAQDDAATTEQAWRFHVRHTARFDDTDLLRLRERLRQNDERAVPWAAVAVPLDREACRLDGEGPANWRVFLPLLEEGPSSCIFNASLFIGPSRQRVEFRLNESDEGRRRTDWNQVLVGHALIPLLQDLSTELPDLAARLLADHPREYLSLFPRVPDDAGKQPTSGLTAFVRQEFSKGLWLLRLPDLWGDPFDILVGDDSNTLALEMIPDWLGEYASRFRELSTPQRRFVRFALGDAVAARVGRHGALSIGRAVAADVALHVLRHADPPRNADLLPLLKAVDKAEDSAIEWEGCWAFGAIADDGLRRFSAQTLYVLDDKQREHAVIAALRGIRVAFERTEWVRSGVGLVALASDLRSRLENVVDPSPSAALELLRRVPNDNGHDQVAQPQSITPIVDFLVAEPWTRVPADARLGFLVKTAHQKESRRERGVILLRPATPTQGDEAIWEVWFRRLFAEVDPGFAREVQRLIAVHPGALELMHAHDCRVAVGTLRDALGVLHWVRSQMPSVFDLLETAMNGEGDQQAVTRQRVAFGLLEIADTQWERLSPEERHTVLALPIHRRPDGQFARLLPAFGAGAVVTSLYRLQSDEDIEDAPISLPSCQLLQAANASARHFYRRRLGLENHGRVSVLKDVLRQVGGGDEAANLRMLQYLVTHYDETLRRLDATKDEADGADARELRTLFATSRTVPCVDGTWCAAGGSVSAWQVAERLKNQGWPDKRISWVLGELHDGERVLRPEESLRKMVQRLHSLREIDPRTIADRAIASESAGLSLKDRAKLLTDNWADHAGKEVVRAQALAALPVPVASGRVRLDAAEQLDAPANLPASILRALAPEAVNLAVLATELSLVSNHVRLVLDAFGVPRRAASDIDGRLSLRFTELWPPLPSGDRLELLRYVGGHGLAERMRDQAVVLETALVATRPQRWVLPARVLQPTWQATEPPNVPLEQQPAMSGVAEAGHEVWQQWCGVRTFADVLAIALSGRDTASTGASVYAWLARVAPSGLTAEMVECLRGAKWVLAQRGEAREFCRPADVLTHGAASILRARFWVPAGTLPEAFQRAQPMLGFRAAPAATAETLRQIGECLEERGRVSDQESALQAYALVDHLCEQSDGLGQEWQRIAARRPVYRTFGGNDRLVTALELFLGDGEHKEDLSRHLLCVKASASLPKGLVSVYRRLHVGETPSVTQVLAALSALVADEEDPRAAHGRLVDVLVKVAGQQLGLGDAGAFGGARVLTCAGSYEPVSCCLWDEEVGRRERARSSRLIDTRDRNTQRLLEWLQSHGFHPTPLRAATVVEVSEAPRVVAGTPELSYLLLPWRQWFQEAERDGSALRERLEKVGLLPPRQASEIVPVARIPVRWRCQDGEVIEAASSWEGPVALTDSHGRLFVRPPIQKPGGRTDIAAIRLFDTAIARELTILAGGPQVLSRLAECTDEILATLERPATVLRRLHDTYRLHFLHQYHDQVADPLFAEMFDEYQRTRSSSPRARELEELMHAQLADGFVRARREQIRGYGYDEFSVFAELLQNAEDAYLQRLRLGMHLADPCEISYRYSDGDDGARVLDVEHRGRPFNYWQHGSHQDKSFSRDVEGVLRSAGSFKPHVCAADAQSAAPTIGRFGLGFKSVYLLSDRPEIHSGAWHFAIEAGCLPEEVPAPEDLDDDATRIRLPLRPDIDVLSDPALLLDLLPFLSMVRRLEFRAGGGVPVVLTVRPEEPASHGSMLLEQVTISAPGVLRDGELRLIRCRSRTHAGQLTLLLSRDGTPARWDEAFDHDLFAVLPLKAELGCGVAASHRFEVQSGRTHLVDPRANAQRFNEVAELLVGVAESLPKCTSENMQLCAVLTRFWALWRWDRGDSECESLRQALAKVLARLAENMDIVPTLAPDQSTKLADGPRFYFFELPDSFRDALVAAGVVFPVANHSSSPQLSPANVVAEGFASAYRRTCEFAGVRLAAALVGIGWSEVARAFQERAWFAEKPALLSSLAKPLTREQMAKVAAWVALCPVLGEDGTGQVVHALPSELLPAKFPGAEHLPKRLITHVSAVYCESALELLRAAGLPVQPSSENLRSWVADGKLTAQESIDVLRYLADSDRFREFWELAQIFRAPWFPAGKRRLTTSESASQGLIPEGLLGNAVFRSWLGLVEVREVPPLEPLPPPRDPGAVLRELAGWWDQHGRSWVAEYEKRIYPAGRPPILRESFSPRDIGDRREWITLFVLAALHTMGRTQLEQHRDFLRRCERKGWLDVFADAEPDARRWMQVLEEYLEDPSGAHEYHQWMKQFVSIFQVSRWLSEYVESFLNIDRIKQPFALDQIVAPRTSAFFSGGGPDAPALTRALGMGTCFVMRELMRLKRLNQPLAYRYCYVPSRRVCTLVEDLGCSSLRMLPPADRSSAIHKFLADHVDAKLATFNHCFDLPLLALSEDTDLQQTLLGHGLAPEEDEPNPGALSVSPSSGARIDEGWRTLPDGRRINVYG